MAQHDMNIANQSFPNFRSDLNNSLSALNSMHSGTSRPSGATTGTMWLDTTNSGSNSLEIKFFDGSDDISFAVVDTSANTINFIDSTVSSSFTLTGDSGSNQTVSSGDTLDIAGGTGIDTVVGDTDTVTVAIDSTVPQLATTNTFTGVNRNALTVDNDGSFDMNANNNFKCTPTGNFTLTFTNFADGQSGYILLINSGGHTVSLHANSKADANLATTVSSAGTYLISYLSDGTNAYLTNSAVFA
jgi:hypothetical protein